MTQRIISDALNFNGYGTLTQNATIAKIDTALQANRELEITESAGVLSEAIFLSRIKSFAAEAHTTASYEFRRIRYGKQGFNRDTAEQASQAGLYQKVGIAYDPGFPYTVCLIHDSADNTRGISDYRISAQRWEQIGNPPLACNTGGNTAGGSDRQFMILIASPFDRDEAVLQQSFIFKEPTGVLIWPEITTDTTETVVSAEITTGGEFAGIVSLGTNPAFVSAAPYSGVTLSPALYIYNHKMVNILDVNGVEITETNLHPEIFGILPYRNDTTYGMAMSRGLPWRPYLSAIRLWYGIAGYQSPATGAAVIPELREGCVRADFTVSATKKTEFARGITVDPYIPGVTCGFIRHIMFDGDTGTASFSVLRCHLGNCQGSLTNWSLSQAVYLNAGTEYNMIGAGDTGNGWARITTQSDHYIGVSITHNLTSFPLTALGLGRYRIVLTNSTLGTSRTIHVCAQQRPGFSKTMFWNTVTPQPLSDPVSAVAAQNAVAGTVLGKLYYTDYNPFTYISVQHNYRQTTEDGYLLTTDGHIVLTDPARFAAAGYIVAFQFIPLRRNFGCCYNLSGIGYHNFSA